MSSPFNSTKAHPIQLGSRVAVLWGLGMVLGLGAGPCWSQAAPTTKATAPAGTGSTPAKAARTQEPVTLNFVNAEIESVARAISAMINRPIVVDPRVKAPMTLYTERPVPVFEAYLSFLSALRGAGFSMVESGGLLKILPEAEAKLQAGTVLVDEGDKRGDQIVTQIFRLNHEQANNLVAVLRPLISPNNTINVSPGHNSLVITDYADNLQRIARIVAALDQPATTDLEVIPVRHAVASDLAAIVLRMAEGGAAAVPGSAPAPGASGLSVLADPRTNSLIVRAPNAARMAQIRSAVQALDRPLEGAASRGNIWVVYLKNADATRLATVLRAAFAATGGLQGTGTGTAGGTSSATLPAAALPTPVASMGSPSGSAALSTQASSPVQASAAPSTGGFIQADPASNALIITAAEPLYRQIRAVIDQLDARRAQVYVESLIVKIDASKAAEFGLQWQGVAGQKGDRNIVVGGTNFGGGGNNIVNLQLGAASGTITTPPGAGLNLGLIRMTGGVYTLASLARFLETQAGANVLSTPNLVALDNEEAKIVIGQNVPFVTGSFTNTAGGTGAINPFQTIERRDVGLTLRIKSQIGEGGTVRMQVFQENSSVVPGATTAAGPTTDKSSIETSVVVDDGQIIVLGGLLKEEFVDGEDRVPGLGALPVVGSLFRSENKRRVKSNLMVFLRPVVLRTQQSADSVTLDRYDAIRAQQLQLQAPSGSILGEDNRPVLPARGSTAPAPAAATPPAQATPAAPAAVR
ncbi:MAG: type II secretion system secretin GspD [Betaproteobacteria bacterium]